MSIILKPITTEKTRGIGEKLNQYGFRVCRKANKIEIKRAIEELYNVQVVAVNTSIVSPKIRQRYTKKGLQVGAKQAFKKAIVTLKENEKIDFYSNI